MKKNYNGHLVFLIYSFCIIFFNTASLLSYLTPAVSKRDTTLVSLSDLNSSVSYVLRIQYPSSIKIPYHSGYYKGHKLPFNSDVCVIAEACTCNRFILIITEEVNPNLDSENNIKYLERIEHIPCRLFYLTREYNLELGAITWIIEEESSENIPLRLPDNALVLLFNPLYIDKLYYNNATKQTLQGDKNEVIYLPSVIIKPTVTQEEVDNSLTNASLASLNSNAVHRRQKQNIKQQQSVLISMNILHR